jgi:hypothetical protein
MNAITRAKIKSGPKSLYLVLASYNFGSNSEQIIVSQSRLAEDCHTTIRTIRRWTNVLEEQGWIAVFETQGCRHQYELLIPHHPGQFLKEVKEQPRTKSSKIEPDPGQNQSSGNNVQKEPPSTSEKEQKSQTGIQDPWSRFRSDPVVKAASLSSRTRPTTGAFSRLKAAT